ncbi:septum formation initiator family protein [uncultured Salinisphaera sp.]|uniref:septum formation initiator family protein n=1 Tax=uncultured Salinisphaera sp. TaxID=359372 RepID=UPI0032B22572|tara:strand:+ start:525 stop:995 length:471 start_codon:yes stop_codon:yes gene_type:complete
MHDWRRDVSTMRAEIGSRLARLSTDLSGARQVRPPRYNRRMYRAVIIVLVLVLAALQYRLWVADGGWAEVHRLSGMKQELAAANERNQVRNDALQAEVDDLKSGESATEGRARSDMGMIRRDEEFFLTIAPPGPTPPKTRDKQQGNAQNDDGSDDQ